MPKAGSTARVPQLIPSPKGHYLLTSVRFASLDAQTAAESGKKQSEKESHPSLEAIRTSILQSALEEVHNYGWTEDALAAATTNKSTTNNQHMSMSVMGMITVDELIGFCMDQWNDQLKEDLQKKQESFLNESDISDPLEEGLKTRLEYLIPYLESNRWHEGMALGIRGPSNALQTQKQLQQMVDIVVESAGRTELGTPERMALGAVYVATELHLLTDKSPDYEDTWVFLKDRMKGWSQFRSLTSSTGMSSNSGSLNESLFVASSVASSLVGGLVSLVINPSKGMPLSFGVPEGVWAALFQNQRSWQSNSKGRHQSYQYGTRPEDYDVPNKSSSTKKE